MNIASILLTLATVSIAIAYCFNTHRKRHATINLSKDTLFKSNRIPNHWIQLIIVIIQSYISILTLLSIDLEINLVPQPYVLKQTAIVTVIQATAFWILSNVYNAYYTQQSNTTKFSSVIQSQGSILTALNCLIGVELNYYNMNISSAIRAVHPVVFTLLIVYFNVTLAYLVASTVEVVIRTKAQAH